MTEAQLQYLIAHKAVPHPTNTLELVETHISWVLLGDAFVYKIKKPLKLSFLDFSTLAKRKAYCEQEVVLNRRLAPAMYLGILPVHETSGGCVLGGPAGGPIDYAVLMRRMDTSRQMDLLLERGAVDLESIHGLADRIAQFHRDADKVPEGEDWRELYEEFADLKTVQAFLEDHLGRHTGRLIQDANEWALNFLKGVRGRIGERNARGFVVDGHGDLHCRNIFLLEEPVIFDCIEFNEDFRKLDVLSEVAFLAMDLERFGRKELSAAFCKRYFAQYPCLENKTDERLFLFYKMYRANVRMKVTAIQLLGKMDRGIHPEERSLLTNFHGLFRSYYIELSTSW